MLEAIELLLVGVLALLSALATARVVGAPVDAPATEAGAPGSPRPHATGAGRAPARIGSYALGGMLAAGAMGVVYRARDVRSGRPLALKLLSPDANARERAQFEREARAGALVDHPHAVAVFDHGSADDGTRYLAMELIDGVSLEQRVALEGPLAPARVIPILLQIASALQHLHALGLVHRDIKPQNILLCHRQDGEERAKLIDFGLVKEVADATSSADTVVGTPLYISPEALTTPDAVDARCDLYGLGAVAHFLLSGAPVFSGRSVLEVCGHHLCTPPEPLSQLVGWSIGSDLERIVLDCLAKEPSARPADAATLIQRLERCADLERRANGVLNISASPLAAIPCRVETCRC